MTQSLPEAPPPTTVASRRQPLTFANVITLLILATTIWTAYLAWIGAVDGDRRGDAARDSQVASINALADYNTALQRGSFELRLLARYDDLTIQAAARTAAAETFRAAGDLFRAKQTEAEVERLKAARETLKPFSIVFTDTAYLDKDGRPDLARRHAELFEPAYRSEETQIVLSRQSSAVAIKTDTYTLLITIAAVSLFLFGLSLTLETRLVRISFGALGTVFILASMAWFAVIRAAPEPTLTDDAIAAYARGRVAAEQNRPDAAITHYSEAIAKAGNPTGYARAHLQRGEAYRATRQVDKALADFSAAIALEPSPDAYAARGNANLDKRAFAQAEADFQRAFDASPDSDDDVSNLGWAQYEGGKLDAAIVNLRKAIKLNDQLPVYHFNLGVALLAKKDLAGAAAAYAAGLKLVEDKPVELVGWQLEGAIEDLNALLAAPANASDAAVKGASDGALTDLRTRLARIGGRISEIVFATRMNGAAPADNLTVVEPATKELFIAFDFTGMVDGARVSTRVSHNGAPAPALSREEAGWDKGAEGSGFVQITTAQAGFAPGGYKVEIVADGKALGSATFRARPTGLRFSEVEFAEKLGLDGKPLDPSYLFAAGTRQIVGVFEFANMLNGVKWSALWWRGDEELKPAAAPAWNLGVNGVASVTLSSDKPLAPGEYTLALLVEGDLVQETGFRVIEISDQLGKVSFSAEIDGDANPVEATDVFEVGARQIYASFDHAAINPGAPWSVIWYRDGEAISRVDGIWRARAAGRTWVLLSDQQTIAPGEYDLEIRIDGKVGAIASLRVIAP
ncbi:MAG: tetratricopeptide repeat protein [Thermoflexales bacterium]